MSVHIYLENPERYIYVYVYIMYNGCMYNERGLLLSSVYVSRTEYIYPTCTYKNPTETRFAELCIPYLSKPGDFLGLLNGNLP